MYVWYICVCAHACVPNCMWGQEQTSVVFLGTLHLVFGLGVSQWPWRSPRLAAQRAPAIPLLCLLRAEIIDVWCYTPTPLLNVCFGDLNSDPYACVWALCILSSLPSPPGTFPQDRSRGQKHFALFRSAGYQTQGLVHAKQVFYY